MLFFSHTPHNKLTCVFSLVHICLHAYVLLYHVSIWFYLENDICASCYDSRGGMPLSALINKNVLPPPPPRPITKIRKPPPYVHLRAAAAAAARPLVAADIWRNIFSKTHCVRIWGASVRMKIYARQSLLCRENYSSAALTHIMSRAYMRVRKTWRKIWRNGHGSAAGNRTRARIA